MNKTLLLTALVSASAFAQETAPPPPPPQPPPQPIGQPVARPLGAPISEEDPGGRVRWGVSGNLGWHVPQPAFSIGAEGRIGYQINNIISAYAILGGVGAFGFGGGISSSGVTLKGTLISYGYFGAIAEFIFGNVFYVLGGGPVLANGTLVGGSISAGSGGGISGYYHTGWSPGLDLRLGVGLGRQNPAPSFRRGGFNIGLSAVTLFRSDTVVTRVVANDMGGSIDVDTKELLVTVTPMLMLGYDSR